MRNRALKYIQPGIAGIGWPHNNVSKSRYPSTSVRHHKTIYSKSTILQLPRHKQFLNNNTVQFLGGTWPDGTAIRLTNSFTTGGSSIAERIPHRLHFRTFPGERRCLRKVSHNVALAGGSIYCAPGGRIVESPSHVVSKNITAGMSRGDWVPIRRSVTV